MLERALYAAYDRDRISLPGVSAGVNNISEDCQVYSVEKVEYDRRVRIGIARLAILLGGCLWALYAVLVIYLSYWWVPDDVRNMPMMEPLIQWLWAGPGFFFINASMVVAEHRTNVAMSDPGDLRTAKGNMWISLIVFLAWSAVGAAFYLAEIAVDQLLFVLAGIIAYYLISVVYNRSWNWGPIPGGRTHRLVRRH